MIGQEIVWSASSRPQTGATLREVMYSHDPMSDAAYQYMVQLLAAESDRIPTVVEGEFDDEDCLVDIEFPMMDVVGWVG
jgi:hypothetical protein